MSDNQTLENENSALKKQVNVLRQLNGEAVEAANITNSKWHVKFKQLEGEVKRRTETMRGLQRLGDDLRKGFNEMVESNKVVRKKNIQQLGVLLSIKSTIENKTLAGMSTDEAEYLIIIDKVLEVK